MKMKQREKDYHNQAIANNPRKKTEIFYTVYNSVNEFYNNFIKNNCDKQKILEIGSGKGEKTIIMAQNGGIINSIDISDASINYAKNNNNHPNIEYFVMDAEHLEFQDNYFDIVCGESILHHLDLEKTLLEIRRVINPNGKALFREPLGHNIFINIFRKLTPRQRTVDEHPLTINDLKLFKKYFNKVEFKYFYMASMLAIVFNKLPCFKNLLNTFEKFDNFLFKHIPFTRKYAWQVCVILSEPKDTI